MRHRHPAPWLAPLLLAFVLVAFALGSLADAGEGEPLFLVPFAAYAGVGTLVAMRRPDHSIGWLFLTIGVATAAATLYPYVEWHPALRVLPALGWYVGFGLAVSFALLLFPTGHVPSPRWRVVGWMAVAGMVGLGVGDLLDQLAPDSAPAVLRVASDVGALVFVASVAGSVGSLVVRFRRSRGQERQQLKWFAAAAVLVAIGLVATIATEEIPELAGTPLWAVVNVAWPLALATVPAAAGLAILRYRLYDIDLLINHTLVYGALTVMLGGIYAGSVIGLQGLFSGFAGGSSLAVAASTLTVAALFQPVRGRVQRAVDRRFYRSRYDAAKTLEAFSTRLRHEVDLARLTDELSAVVDEVLQPASVSVWLRPARSSDV